MTKRDTIAAIATAPGRGAIGVVRVSGTQARPIIRDVLRCEIPARTAVLARFRDSGGGVIDEGLALYFPAPHSYTGEDVFEMQGHGGPVVLRTLLQRCVELGARIAEPGEFTQRAFLNGKLDLAQAEAVADLIEASTHQAARSAIRSLRGEFSAKIQLLSEKLITVRTLLEGSLDFPEEDVDFESTAVHERVTEVQNELDAVLNAAQRGSLLREGISVVLAGRPNVGKSSLLNQLAGEDIAIVTEIPGTTRDAVRQTLDLEGVPVRIVDTAGLRDTAEPVERIGVERAWSAISEADAVMVIIDATSGVTPADEIILARLPEAVPRVRVMNKIDLLGRPPALEQHGEESVVWLSAKTGAGIDLLRQRLLELIGWRGHAEGTFLARERHLVALRDAKAHVSAAAGPHTQQPELIAEELRLAHAALGTITGDFASDDLLGQIFARFCIGK